MHPVHITRVNGPGFFEHLYQFFRLRFCLSIPRAKSYLHFSILTVSLHSSMCVWGQIPGFFVLRHARIPVNCVTEELLCAWRGELWEGHWKTISIGVI